MTLQEEFHRLINLFKRASEGQPGTTQDVVYKSLEFIEHIKEQIKTGDEEDKQEAIRMMLALSEQMKAHTKYASEKAGVSEEQLAMTSENPANFTPQQWRLMQECKKKLSKMGSELAQVLHKDKKTSELPASKSTTSHKKKGKVKKMKKSQWMRS